jgi:hypothetical protein
MTKAWVKLPMSGRRLQRVPTRTQMWPCWRGCRPRGSPVLLLVNGGD